MANNPYAQQARQQYHQQQIETATPEQILIMLYEGAIRFLSQSKRALEAGQLEKAHNQNIKAQRIITELMTSLDLEIGGEMAMNLYRLYDYFNFRLVEANTQRDTAKIDEVITHLRQLKETWVTAIDIAQKERVGSANGDKVHEELHV
jgi:flagellar protein FliS